MCDKFNIYRICIHGKKFFKKVKDENINRYLEPYNYAIRMQAHEFRSELRIINYNNQSSCLFLSYEVVDSAMSQKLLLRVPTEVSKELAEIA
jgi:hypothetical protein